jgi:dihydroceramide fatty acyl 2-hydroxylase
MATSTNTSTEQQKAMIRKASSSVFNYWFGYVANISLVLWLTSRAFEGSSSKLSLGAWAICISSGLLLWTLAEYFLHKWLYHEIQSPVKIGHDLHHDEPRALMGVPWYLTAIVLVGIYYGFASMFDPAKTGVVMAFTWLGYIGYCFVHHSTHHFNFKNSYFQMLRKHHLIHHHSKEGVNWGITSDIWDRVFKTKA